MFEQARVIVRLLVALGLCDASDSELFPRYMIIAEEVQRVERVAGGESKLCLLQCHVGHVTSFLQLLLAPAHEQVSREECERN